MGDTNIAQSVSDNVVCGQCGDSPVELSRFAKLSLIVGSILFFASINYLTFKLLTRYVFKTNSLARWLLGENISQVASTLHTLIVCPMGFVGMRRTSWGPNYEPLGNTSFMELVLIISLGYFVVDFFIVAKFNIPNCNIFLAHHCIAMCPLIAYLFRTCSSKALYLIGCFILLEVTNAPFNALTYMRHTGNTKSHTYVVILYLTAALWVVFRLINPLWCIICTHLYILPSTKQEGHCLWPSIFCEYVVLVFCYVAFVTELGQEIVKRWTHNNVSVTID